MYTMWEPSGAIVSSRLKLLAVSACAPCDVSTKRDVCSASGGSARISAQVANAATAVDLPHAPFADLRDDFVNAETGSSGQGQRRDYKVGATGQMAILL